VAAAAAFWLAIAGACAGPPSAGPTSAAEELDRPRAENVRLARRVAELEVAVADARRARRKPMDQPVVRAWIERVPADEAAVAFDLCISYFAHGDFLDLLPNSLAIACRQFAVPASTGSSAALHALVTSADFTCWSRAANDQPLPTCWR